MILSLFFWSLCSLLLLLCDTDPLLDRGVSLVLVAVVAVVIVEEEAEGAVADGSEIVTCSPSGIAVFDEVNVALCRAGDREDSLRTMPDARLGLRDDAESESSIDFLFSPLVFEYGSTLMRFCFLNSVFLSMLFFNSLPCPDARFSPKP